MATENKQTKSIGLKVDPEIKHQLQQNADAAGKPLSHYLRDCGLADQKSGLNKRNNAISFNVTLVEKSALKQRAKKADKTLSSYVRDRVLKGLT